MQKANEKKEGVRGILDKTLLVAHNNQQLSVPFLIGMRELVKIFKKDDALKVKKFIDAVEVDFMRTPGVATALVSTFKEALPGYVASPQDKEVVADFFDLCETQLFTALSNSFENKNPEIKEHHNIGDLLVNKKGGRRLITGLNTYEKNGKRAVNYQYMDGDNKNGQCDHVSMVSWLAK